ncbi:MAG: hypothetical protein CUN55_19055, partial [Phototrophicales bacterium]
QPNFFSLTVDHRAKRPIDTQSNRDRGYKFSLLYLLIDLANSREDSIAEFSAQIRWIVRTIKDYASPALKQVFQAIEAHRRQQALASTQSNQSSATPKSELSFSERAQQAQQQMMAMMQANTKSFLQNSEWKSLLDEVDDGEQSKA